MPTHTYRLLSSFSVAAIKHVAQNEMKRNKQRIIHTEKFNILQFHETKSLSLSICFCNHFDHNLHLNKVAKEQKRQNTKNTIELMNVKCEFNQAFNSPFFPFIFFYSVNYFSREFELNSLGAIHNFNHQRVL